jgi:hypothetical protein
MKIAYALHSIIRQGGEVSPGEIVEFSDEEYEELIVRNAVRPLTSDEAALHGFVPPAAVEVPNPSDEEMGNIIRSQLEAKAYGLGIKFSAKLSDEKLLERITAAEQSDLLEF